MTGRLLPRASFRRASGLPSGLRGFELEGVEINPGTRLHVDEIGDANLEPVGDRVEHIDRRVPPPALDLRKIAKSQPDRERRVRLGPPEPPSSPLDAGRDATAEGGGAHPVDETSPCFQNVTHSRSLRCDHRRPRPEKELARRRSPGTWRSRLVLACWWRPFSRRAAEARRRATSRTAMPVPLRLPPWALVRLATS